MKTGFCLFKKEGSKPTEKDEQYYVASQGQLIRKRFQKHKMAMFSLWVVGLLYVTAIFAGFIGPYDPNAFDPRHTYAPPHKIHFFHEGKFRGPFVYKLEKSFDPKTYQRTYIENKSEIYPLVLFPKGDPYKFLFFEFDRHLFGVEGGKIFLFGADRMGRDLFSRVLHGARVSLSIGLLGVFISLMLGLFLGGLSGYFGGKVDLVIQRLIEFIMSLPTLPLWMGLTAALPMSWSPTRIYFMITIILSLMSWTGLARVVRGKLLSLRDEDFVVAARLSGASELRIIFRHMLPSFMSHVIATMTLSIPRMILSESSLSFLGVGLRPPAISWGVLLQEAQNIYALASAPWLLIPGIFIVVAVLSMNFVGDGLRDAADPYSN